MSNFTQGLESLPQKPTDLLNIPSDLLAAFNEKLKDTSEFTDIAIKTIKSKVYNLSDDADNKQYTKDRKHIYLGALNNTIKPVYTDKQFVACPKDSTGTWIAHLEWIELDIIKSKQ